MANSATPLPHVLRAQRRSLLWRLHFWAALIASPFALLATLTGIVYVLTPQVEDALYGHLEKVAPMAERMPLDALVPVAQQAAPEGWVVHSLVPAYHADDSLQVAFVTPPHAKAPAKASGGGHSHGDHASHTGGGTAKASTFLPPNRGFPGRAQVVFVNPYTAEVLGTMKQEERFSNWARKLHSNYLQNDNWRWMIELAASWLMVMLVTGVYLWWPQRKPLLPQSSASGRVAWRQWHAFVGIALSVMSAVILTTGLTWSKYAGDQVKWLRDVTGQAPPRIPGHFVSQVPADGQMLSWQAAWQAAQRAAPDVSMQLMQPKGAEGVWRANQMDRSQPTLRFDVLLDAYTGAPLFYSGWDQQTTFGKATAIGIPFHRGEFGIWNQLVLLVFGFGVLFSIITGWVMYFKRRSKGYQGLPVLAKSAWKSVHPVAYVASLALFLLMPLLALSSALVLALEGFWWWRGKGAVASGV
jgi:uncharacterized iron-regulated membrane protein